MLSRARELVAPLYLFACLILGGSAQGIWANMVLQLAGLAIIVWAAIGTQRESEEIPRPARQLLILVIFALVVVAAQLIPLPPDWWATLEPRQQLAQGFEILGIRIPSEPLSLTPAAGLAALLSVIVPVAVFCAIARLKAYRPQWLAIALIAGTIAGIALGAAQVATSQFGASSWYLYEDTNPGRAVGFFANADHMASLLVVTIPFLAALVAGAKTGSVQRRSAVIAIAAGVGLVILVGLVLNGSLAGYGLGLGVIAASTLIILPPGNRFRLAIAVFAALLLIGAVALLETSATGSNRIGQHATGAVQSRAELLSTTLRAAREFMPFGSGLGSFRDVYPLYERAAQVTTTYAVHAHNEYAELVLELGLPGVLLIILFLSWWGWRVWRVWRAADAAPFARAAAIASAALLIHSVVDFPLRTAALAGCLGMCMALLAGSDMTPRKEDKDLRPVRHLVIT
jgi:O-antigen ligase